VQTNIHLLAAFTIDTSTSGYFYGNKNSHELIINKKKSAQLALKYFIMAA
jgi:hypothetical protein